MAYQPFSIIGGNGGFSVYNADANGASTPTRSGSISCLSGSCYVRLLKTATVTSSGQNANLAPLPVNVNGYVDEWAYLPGGATLTFGQEQVNGATQSITEPVAQIDIYCDSTSTVTCLQH